MQYTKAPGEMVSPFRSLRTTAKLAWQGLRMWNARQIAVAGLAAVGTLLLIGLATVLIPNSIFARDIPPVWWNYPVWLMTSLFSGMLLASYVRAPGTGGQQEAAAEGERRSRRFGLAGAVLAWFAVGCPVCNKIALLALGYTGAIAWFAPIQPFLAVAALLLTGGALLGRLRGSVACPVTPSQAKVGA